MEDSIAQAHADCIVAFQELCNVAQEQEHELSNDLDDEFDKYKVWAGNVGAAHYGRNFNFSLDYRLAEATIFKDQVRAFLEIITNNAERATTLILTEKSSVEDAGSSTEEEDDDSPWDISSQSEEESSLPRMPRHKLTGQGRESATMPSAHGTLPINQQALAERLAAIQTTISCLYKLPIRQPAPFDRLKDKSSEATSCFHFYDVSYVRDKFPDLDPDVAARLAKMITRRRQLIEYRRTHQRKIITGLSTGVKVPLRPNSMAPEQFPATARQENDQRTVAPSSKATKFPQTSSLDLGRLIAPSVAASDVPTSVVGSEATKELKVEVPPRPRNEKNGSFRKSFDCAYCSLAVTALDDKTWKKHVLADLQPYVCTHKDCTLPDQMFESREAWYTHEMQSHRVVFSCGEQNHQTFFEQAFFETHMKEAHDIPLSKSPNLLYNFRRPQQALGVTCNLCFRKTTSLKHHIARHLEQVALFAILRAEYNADDEALEDDKSCSGNNVKGSEPDASQVPLNSSESSENDPSLLLGVDQEVSEKNEEQVDQVDVPDVEDPLWEHLLHHYQGSTEGIDELRSLELDLHPDSLPKPDYPHIPEPYAPSRFDPWTAKWKGDTYISCTCFEAIHGMIGPNDKDFATLAIFTISYSRQRTQGIDKIADISFEFSALSPAEAGPGVLNIAPYGESKIHHCKVVGAIEYRRRDHGGNSVASWTLMEHDEFESPYYSAFSVAILLTRRDEQPFKCDVKINVTTNTIRDAFRKAFPSNRRNQGQTIEFRPKGEESHDSQFDAQKLGYVNLDSVSHIEPLSYINSAG